MLLPYQRIAGNREQQIEIVGPKRPQLDQLAFEGSL